MNPWHGQTLGLVGMIVLVYRKMPRHLQRLLLRFLVAAVFVLGAGAAATLAYTFRQPTLQAQEDAALVALPLFLSCCWSHSSSAQHSLCVAASGRRCLRGPSTARAGSGFWTSEETTSRSRMSRT